MIQDLEKVFVFPYFLVLLKFIFCPKQLETIQTTFDVVFLINAGSVITTK